MKNSEILFGKGFFSHCSFFVSMWGETGNQACKVGGTGTPGDGWISGPAAKPNAGGGSNFFTDPVPKNMKGDTITSFDFGASGTQV
jgi:hypothetical protein